MLVVITPEPFAELMKSRMRELDLRQRDVAKAVGKSQSWVSLLTRAPQMVRLSQQLIHQLANVLQLPPERLIEAAGWRPTPEPMTELRGLLIRQGYPPEVAQVLAERLLAGGAEPNILRPYSIVLTS